MHGITVFIHSLCSFGEYSLIGSVQPLFENEWYLPLSAVSVSREYKVEWHFLCGIDTGICLFRLVRKEDVIAVLIKQFTAVFKLSSVFSVLYSVDNSADAYFLIVYREFGAAAFKSGNAKRIKLIVEVLTVRTHHLVVPGSVGAWIFCLYESGELKSVVKAAVHIYEVASEKHYIRILFLYLVPYTRLVFTAVKAVMEIRDKNYPYGTAYL